MTAARPRLYNIPADADFLIALATAIDHGDLPLPGGKPPLPHELPHWTILVPNRRAARALSEAFLTTSASGARLLPRIRPIGDIDEDLLGLSEDPAADDVFLAPAISQAGREFLLLSLIADWARDNPHESLSRDLAQSSAHRIGFAESLAQLIDKIETEGKDLLDLAELYDIDLATHRQTLIGLLGTIRDNYPRRLEELGFMDPTARRDALIRHQARELLKEPPPFPVIAAGSTGSIPATAELLRIIASLDRGAVILPGLDTEMDGDRLADDRVEVERRVGGGELDGQLEELGEGVAELVAVDGDPRDRPGARRPLEAQRDIESHDTSVRKTADPPPVFCAYGAPVKLGSALEDKERSRDGREPAHPHRGVRRADRPAR